MADNDNWEPPSIEELLTQPLSPQLPSQVLSRSPSRSPSIEEILSRPLFQSPSRSLSQSPSYNNIFTYSEHLNRGITPPLYSDYQIYLENILDENLEESSFEVST